MAQPRLHVAAVTKDNALLYCRGVLSAEELWQSSFTEPGTCLFVNGIEGKETWRCFCALCVFLNPSAVVFASNIPSIVKRCGKFGASLMRSEPRPDGVQHFWFAEGQPLRAFLGAQKTVGQPVEK